MTTIIVGGTREKQIQEFRRKVAAAGCDYAAAQNITAAICKEEKLAYKCQIKMKAIIDGNYLSADLINPKTKKAISLDETSYVQISFDNKKILCDYKEG